MKPGSAGNSLSRKSHRYQGKGYKPDPGRILCVKLAPISRRLTDGMVFLNITNEYNQEKLWSY
jgi:hypothetical protein